MAYATHQSTYVVLRSRGRNPSGWAYGQTIRFYDSSWTTIAAGDSSLDSNVVTVLGVAGLAHVVVVGMISTPAPPCFAMELITPVDHGRIASLLVYFRGLQPSVEAEVGLVSIGCGA